MNEVTTKKQAAEEELRRKVIADIDAGVPKSIIANKYKIKFSNVCNIDNQYQQSKKRFDTIEKEGSKMETVVATVKEEPVVKKKGGKRKVTDDVYSKMIEMHKSGYAIQDISLELNLSNTTVHRYCKEYDLEHENEKPHRKVVSIQTEIPVPPDNTNTITSHTVSHNETRVSLDEKVIVEAGMIAERHHLPVHKHVFEKSLDEIDMFNYKALDETVKNFIESNITFDEKGEGKQTLVVYVTGLTCCLAAVIKGCQLHKVNLILKHFNTSDNTYHEQVIFDQFGTSIEKKIFPDTNTLVLRDCSITDLISAKEYYCTKVVDYTDKINKKVKKIVSLDKNTIFDDFSNESREAILFRGTPKAIVFSQNTIENGEDKAITVLSRTTNFDKHKIL